MGSAGRSHPRACLFTEMRWREGHTSRMQDTTLLAIGTRPVRLAAAPASASDVGDRMAPLPRPSLWPLAARLALAAAAATTRSGARTAGGTASGPIVASATTCCADS